MTNSQSHNPYVGPRPFEREEKNLFFGREREISELQSLLTAHRTLLLYAGSGAGKTSLLNAGLLPLMEQEGFDVLPVARVRGLIPEGVGPEDISNLYVFNILMGWTDDEMADKTLARMSLAEFLKTREHILDSEGFSAPRLIIFDQFEELFTLYEQHWKQRADFFHQVAEALEEDPVLRVLFVLREDYLAKLDPYVSLLPEQLRARYRLVRLGFEDACWAVEGPLKGSGRSFADGVAAHLVGELLKTKVQSVTGETVEAVGEYVEPVQLQIVCRNLWDSLPADVTVITSGHLHAFADVDEALKGFYENAVQKTISETTATEEELRKWFARQLITPAGTRGTVYRGKEDTAGIPNVAVDILENEHILRGEQRAGAHWYELTHDRLVEPIRNSNEIWLTDYEVEQARLRARKKLRNLKIGVAVLILFSVLAYFWYFSLGKKWTITASSGPNGSISPTGLVPVHHRRSMVFTITPKQGYCIAEVMVDDKSVKAVPEYQFKNVTSEHSILAIFAKMEYTITASSGADGSISPTGPVPVTHSDSMAFAIKPKPGYRIADVKVDSRSVGADSRYGFKNVTSDHTIEASFMKVNPLATSHTITASSGPNGSISPTGPVPVTHSDSQAFTITPHQGYRIADVKVDGESVGAVPRYTIKNVARDRTISASFERSIPIFEREAFNPQKKGLELSNKPALNPTRQITLEAWFNTYALGTRQAIIYKPCRVGWGGEPYYQYNLELRQTGQLYFALAIDGTRRYIDGAFSVPPTKWYHVAATYDGNIMRLYLNGEEWRNPKHYRGRLSIYKTPLDIGVGRKGSGNPDRPFKGKLSEVRIWNVARTANQIRAAMHDTIPLTDGLAWSSTDWLRLHR